MLSAEKKEKTIRYIASNRSQDGEHQALLQEFKKEKRKRQAFIGLFFLALAIIFSGTFYIDFRFLAQKKQYHYQNVLAPIPEKSVNWKKLEKYVQYIVDKTKLDGINSIYGKWAEKIPVTLRKCSRNKLELLGAEGFKVAGVFMDKKKIYYVKCVANTTDRDIVFFDIVKESQSDGKKIFRLLRAY